MNAQLRPREPRIPYGVHPDIPAEAYHERRLDVANATGLKLISARSLAHFRDYIENPDGNRETPALRFGKALHCATLEPDVFAATYAVLPEDAPQRPTAAMLNARKRSPESEARCNWWSDWEAEHGDRIVLSNADYDRAQRMADSVRAHPVAAGLLVGGEREITFSWRDEETGLDCKARADLYAPGQFLMDLKSCVDASPEGFARAVAGYRYDLQQAHYIEGIRNCGDKIDWMVFLAVESESPYVCQPYVLDEMAEQRGWKLRQSALAKQAEAVRTGSWRGYSTELLPLTLPAWAHYGIEE